MSRIVTDGDATESGFMDGLPGGTGSQHTAVYIVKTHRTRVRGLDPARGRTALDYRTIFAKIGERDIRHLRAKI
jgi:hypothetical protein